MNGASTQERLCALLIKRGASQARCDKVAVSPGAVGAPLALYGNETHTAGTSLEDVAPLGGYFRDPEIRSGRARIS